MSNMDALRAKLAALKGSKNVINSGTTISKTEVPNGSSSDNIQNVNSTKETTGTPVKLETKTSTGEARETGDAQKVLARIGRLKACLTEHIPGYEVELVNIHKELGKNPELSHLLKPEEIGVIVQAMCKKKDIVLIQVKERALGKKSLKKTTVEDL